MSGIPEIDLSGALKGVAEQRLKKGQEIDAICQNVGFFSITGHGVDVSLIDSLRERSYEFFNLPLAQKREVAPRHDEPRGYRGLGFESLSAGNERQTPPDIKEYYHFGRENWPEQTYFTNEEGKSYFIPNVWPTQVSHWQSIANAYYMAMEQLTRQLMQLSALGLGLPEMFFEDKIDRHITAMRINHYPAQINPPQAGQLRAGAHTDYGLLTILNGENKPGGLEVLTKQGKWIAVETEPHSFVVNIGDLLMRWTNDRWVSNTHRVVNPPSGSETEARISMAFFHHPNYDAVIECIDHDAPAKYPPVRSGTYRTQKYQQTRV